MRSPIRTSILIIFFLQVLLLKAQLDVRSVPAGTDIVLQGRNKSSEANELIFQASWQGVPGANAEFTFQRMPGGGEEHVLVLNDLLEPALGIYLDHRIHFSKQGVMADLPVAQLVMEMNAIIASALEVFGGAEVSKGLSRATVDKLDRLVKIDWAQARFSVDGGNDQDKYLAIYYYVRSQREAFEEQLSADLLPLASIQMLGEERFHPGRTVQVNSSCGTVFDDQEFMCALDLQLADSGIAVMDVQLADDLIGSLKGTTENDSDRASDDRIRKRDRWLKAELDRINERIDKIDQRKELWELRDRMDDLNDRLTGLEMEVREGKGGTARPENALADLSELTGLNITIRFDRGAIQIDPSDRMLLNEVSDQMVRSPAEKVLITGYTDRTGDPAVNLKLSEQRAKAVRNYLLQRGIAADRLLVNFYGDSRSTTNDPSQRRVEIEWLR